MRPPSSSVALFGHPIVAGPLMLTGVSAIGLLLAQGQAGGFILAAPIAVGLARLAKAMEAVSAFRAWKREWDSMDDAPPRRHGSWKLIVATLFTVLVIAQMAMHPDHTGVQAGAVFIGLGLLLALAAFMVRGVHRLWGKRPRTKASPNAGVVTICARPVLPVPSLRDAYSALPDYCWQVLGR